MTKFCRMSVTVPVDDRLPVEQVHAHLRGLLEERGTEILVLAAVAETDAVQVELSTGPRTARVHWPAVDVLQAVERLPVVRPAKGPGKPARGSPPS